MNKSLNLLVLVSTKLSNEYFFFGAERVLRIGLLNTLLVVLHTPAELATQPTRILQQLEQQRRVLAQLLFIRYSVRVDRQKGFVFVSLQTLKLQTTQDPGQTRIRVYESCVTIFA